MATARAESALAAAVRADGDVKLIPYLMAGYPDRAGSVELGRMYARSGRPRSRSASRSAIRWPTAR